MALQEDLIDFNVIELHKENIQALPGGRSARALAQIYSPPLVAVSSPNDTHTTVRAAFERELLQQDEADDPLDIYDRYVKWTLETYPSAQATPQSQLLPLLERATKAFQSSAQYKNDSRYLKLWLHYINLFSDAPREAFIFLSRHNIGESLALFYEEFAAWSENAGRWTQAEEIYQMGIDKAARPVERLIRKSKEFESRKATRVEAETEPSSPALPIARPALAAKIDPFATTTQQQASTAKKPKSKMQIFADEDNARPLSDSSSKGWDNIGTIAERKKENTIAPKPMAGETLKVGKTNGGVQKMIIFRDTHTKTTKLPPHMTDATRRSAHAKQCVVNPKNGRLECVAVNLEAVYPGGMKSEKCFEELRAQYRGWKAGYSAQIKQDVQAKSPRRKGGFKIFEDSGIQPQITTKAVSPVILETENDENSPLGASVPTTKKARREERANRTCKIEIPDVRHIKNETKTVQLNMDSPQTKPKKKRVVREATMTINTKEAMDEIYDIFSQPLPSQTEPTLDDDDTSDDAADDDDYTTDGESSGTGKVSVPVSEYGEDTRRELLEPQSEHAGWGEDEHGQHKQDLLGMVEALEVNENNFHTQTVPLVEESDLPNYQSRAYNALPNHRLPFMTPIAEATESSLGTVTHRKELLSAKTPSRQIGSIVIDEDELLSSPFQEVTTELEDVKQRVLQPIRTKSTKGNLSLGQGSASAQIAAKVQLESNVIQKGPIITDLQCNPMDPQLRQAILTQMRPGISTLDGYHAHESAGGRSAEIRRWAKTVAKTARSSTPHDRLPSPVMSLGSSSYTFKRELGAGTFAPVYLVENNNEFEDDSERYGSSTHRTALEAIKMEDPPSVWEYYIINLAHRRLGVSRSAESIVRAHEIHIFPDECFLVEQYRDQGTLLDLVNTCRLDTPATGMDEMLAMWLTVELLRTVEALHAKQIIHGDLKGDNMMIRFDDAGMETDWSSMYCPSGAHGWSSKGICLIDFGRGIDLKQFVPGVGFIADWKTTEADCAEMRELRPWTYQIDYYGLAGTIHSMLFGKYMETVSERGTGIAATKTYRIRESFKRYWQTEIWSQLFNCLLNPMANLEGEEGRKMPILNAMRSCRDRMENWLEDNCEKGAGLKNMITKLEHTMRERKRKIKSSCV